MRPAEQYADMAEKAIDKAGNAQEGGNANGAYMHMIAAQTLSNLAVAAATIASIEEKKLAGKHGYL